MATTRVGLYHDPRKKHPWSVRWFGEFDPTTDQKKRYSKSFRLKRDAEGFQAQKQAEFDKGGQRDRPADITLKEFCDKYMARRRHEWAEKTRRQLAHLCTRFVDYFGAELCLRAVTPSRANAFWSEAVRVRTGFEGQQISRDTRNRFLRDAKTMFKYAVDWGHLVANPFAGMRQLRVSKRNRRNWHYVKPEEYMALLKVAPTLRWKVFYALAYTSAARSGELFNLTRENIDFERARLLITSCEGTADLPPFRIKDHEDRHVPLPRHTLKLLAGLLKVQPSGSPFILLTPERNRRVLRRWCEHRAAEKPWLSDYMASNTVREIRRHAKQAGLKLDGTLTMHCFRKSCGQNWADHLPMNVVKELMGHASISTTAEYYSTVSEEHEAKAQWITEAITIGRATRVTDARMTPVPGIDQIRRAS